MELNEFKKLIRYGKKLGLRSLTVGDCSVEFYRSEPELDYSDQPNIPMTGERMPTEDELLFWSSEFEPKVTTEGQP